MSDLIPFAVYADGGCILGNPSQHGVTWAYCFVNEAGERIAEASGVLRPARFKLAVMTNNQAEFFAMAKALATLPDGWSGSVYSDSKATIGRIFEGQRDRNLPDGWLLAAQKHLKRLGSVHPVQLNGHPTKAHLAAGVGKTGRPVSIHQQWCDKECVRLGREFAAKLKEQKP